MKGTRATFWLYGFFLVTLHCNLPKESAVVVHFRKVATFLRKAPGADITPNSQKS